LATSNPNLLDARAAWNPFTVFRSHAFRYLWTANLLSMIGSQISRIGLILYLSEQQSGAVVLAGMLCCDTVPGVIAALLSGALLDRWHKVRVMIGADVIRMLLMLAAALAPSVSVIYLAVGIQSIATVLFGPARSASLPLALDEDELDRANAMDRAASNTTLILAPVLGAQLFLMVGIRATLILDALSYLISALLLLRVTIRQPAPSSSTDGLSSTWNAIREGWRYPFAHPVVLYMIVMSFCSMLCVGIWTPVAPFFIRDFLASGDRTLGLEFAAVGLGGVAGAALAPKLIGLLGRGKVVFWGLLAEAITMSTYSLIRSVPISVALCVWWGVVVSVMLVPFYTILQEIVSENMLGRVFTVSRQAESGATIIAIGLTLVARHVLRPEQIFLVAGLTYVVLVSSSALTRGGRALLRTP
jgi:MFS family permease